MSFQIRSGESVSTEPVPQQFKTKTYPLVWTADDATTYDVDVRLDAFARRAAIVFVQANGNRPGIASCNWAPGAEPSVAELQTWAASCMELSTGKTSAT